MTAVFFDDSLEILVGTIIETLGVAALANGVVLRDATGLLCFASADSAPSVRRRKVITNRLKERLGPYARPDRVLLFSDEPSAQRILNEPDRLIMEVMGGHFCKIVDRRIVGSGWLATPISRAGKPPRVVFASLKGGVGRSTALAVTASDLASRGRNVLVIDLDLEAPGLGELMLTSDRAPRFGVLDYLVESGIGGIPDASLGAFVGTSPLTESGGGRVDVVPALGTRSITAPENVLPKLARAMLENVAPEGTPRSAGTQISEMIDRLSGQESYDAILIDSRSGLAELAAPAVLGLGAIVLLFGTAQQQTIAGYQPLFSGFKLLAMRGLERGISSDWRLMFKPVYAKASLVPQISARYAADIYDLFADNLYDAVDDPDRSELSVNFSADDPEAPHVPLVIPFDPRFAEFDPFWNRDHLTSAFYEQTFRPFLVGLDQLMDDVAQEPDRSMP
jgi:hypothetical protein